MINNIIPQDDDSLLGDLFNEELDEGDLLTDDLDDNDLDEGVLDKGNLDELEELFSDDNSTETEENESKEPDTNYDSLSEDDLVKIAINSSDIQELENLYRDQRVPAKIKVLVLSNRYVPNSIFQEQLMKFKKDPDDICAKTALTIFSNNPGLSSQDMLEIASLFKDDKDVLKMVFNNPRTDEATKKRIGQIN